MATEIDTKLQTVLKQVKGGKPMQFAFLPKGGGGALLADKKIAPKAIAEARKEHGGGSPIRGRVVGEDGGLVFELAAEPPATLVGQLKKVVKEQTGLTLPVSVRVNADADAEPTDEVPGEQPLGETQGEEVTDEAPGKGPPPPPPPDAGRAAVMKRLNALAPALKAAMAGPNAARVQTLFGAANGLLKNNDFAQAGKVLDELEPLVKAGGTPPQPTPDGAKAAVLKRLNALAPAIKAAMAGPNAARVQALFGAANGLLKNNDFAQAGKVLDELEPLVGGGVPPPPPDGAKATVLKRLNALAPALKAAMAGPNAARVQTLFGAANGLLKNNDFVQAGKVLDELEPLVKAGGAPPSPDGDKAAVLKRLSGLTGAIKAALAGPNAARVQTLFGAVNGLLKNNDFAQAGKVLDELESLVGKTAPPKEDRPPQPEETDTAEEEEQEPPSPQKAFFALQKSRVLWDQTHRRMKEQLRQLEQAIVEACEQVNEDVEDEDEVDPDQLAAGTQRLNGILQRLDERLLDKLDEALNAEGEQRRKLQTEAKGIVKEYVAFVTSDPLMAVIDNNGFTDAKIADAVLAALKDLSANL